MHRSCCRSPADRGQGGTPLWSLLRLRQNQKQYGRIDRSTLRVGVPVRTLSVQVDAERQSLRYHAERGNDQTAASCSWLSLSLLIFIPRQSRYHKPRLGRRLNAVGPNQEPRPLVTWGWSGIPVFKKPAEGGTIWPLGQTRNIDAPTAIGYARNLRANEPAPRTSAKHRAHRRNVFCRKI
jgi:hypothetical protein